MIFHFVLVIASIAGGFVAAISGFGIGSILTPTISTELDTKLAVAVVSIPHFAGTFMRFLRLRKHINRTLALTFGAASAIGGLVGAVLNVYAKGPVLGYVLGALLVFAGVSGLTGIAERIELRGPWRWAGGFASALFGGLVGNQGGIRSAAMLGFNLTKQSFVATATVVGLVVDGARMPIYFITEHERIVEVWPIVLMSTSGVILGTAAGAYLLNRIPDRVFKRIVSALVFGLGIYMFFLPA
jgi:uncharacterized protein